MILHLAPDAPWYARAAADTALVAHIGGGVMGVSAGFVALAARKGGTIHRGAGNVFVAAMVVAYAVGAAVAPLIHQPSNAFGALLAIYFVLTARASVKRPEGRAGRFEIAAFLGAVGGALALSMVAALGAREPGLLGGVPSAVFLSLALVAALGAALDLRLVRGGGLTGANRVRRHLWRMCTAMFVGTGSLFLGQPRLFPAWLRGSAILWVLALAPLAAMTFWLIRTRTRSPAALAAGAAPLQGAL